MDDPKDPGPARILHLIMAFYESRALIAAVELDLFNRLSEGPADARTLCGAMGLHSRGAADFLDALVALELLERDGEGRYRNSAEAGTYLVRGAPQYVGGYARLAGAALIPLWGGLTEALRTGEPQVPDGAGFLNDYQDQDLAERFMDAMDAVNRGVGAVIERQLDWSAHRTFADVGGGRGNLAAALVRAHPHLRGTCADLLHVEPLFARHMERRGTRDQVAFHGGDFFAGPLPAADVLIFGHILHYFGPKQRIDLLEKAFAALPEGGVVLVYDRMIGAERRGPALSLLGSLNMVLTSQEGREYTEAECRRWLESTGFRVETVRPAGALDTLAVARKVSGAR